MKLFVSRSRFAKEYFQAGKEKLEDPYYIDGQRISHREELKSPKRTEIVNFLLSLKESRTRYLEIGVRDPNDNFNQIQADEKYSVDPGVEFAENPVDFKVTSDEFFERMSEVDPKNWTAR